MRHFSRWARGLCILAVMLAAPAHADATDEAETITLSSTTSTRDSGLFEHLLPKFEAATGVRVRVIAVGTGRAIDLARRGDADVLLVHHRPSEEAFVAEGYGLARHAVMYNDFVLVGPAEDPAGVAGGGDITKALEQIARSEALFLSRGDDSGTHKAERALWQATAFDPETGPGTWYRETGSGMGATLNTANQLPAYTLTDRGTWVAFRNREGLALLVEHDPRMRNEYGVIAVDPARHPHTKIRGAQAFVDWITSAAGREAIAGFRARGEPLFFPVEPAGPLEAELGAGSGAR